MGNVTPMTGVVTSGSPNSNQTATPVVLVNPDGTSAGTVKPQTKPADSTASDVPTLKADFNSLLALLKTAGVLKSSPLPHAPSPHKTLLERSRNHASSRTK